MEVVADIMSREGRVFLLSQYGPYDGEDWPCVSFPKVVGPFLQAEFVAGRDVLIYTGTSTNKTLHPDHRKRLLSAVVVDPTRMYPTLDLVPRDSAQRWGNEDGRRWPEAMKAIVATEIATRPFPAAADVAPNAYRTLGLPPRNLPSEVRADERTAIMRLAISRVELGLSEATVARPSLSPAASIPSVRQEMSRLAHLICDRVQRSGITELKTYPARRSPTKRNLECILIDRWKMQSGRCALCDGGLQLLAANPMLQASVDRINSYDCVYDAETVHIVHLGCNLAKNEYRVSDYREWLAVVRGA